MTNCRISLSGEHVLLEDFSYIIHSYIIYLSACISVLYAPLYRLCLVWEDISYCWTHHIYIFIYNTVKGTQRSDRATFLCDEV